MEVVGAHGERLVLSKASENNQITIFFTLCHCHLFSEA